MREENTVLLSPSKFLLNCISKLPPSSGKPLPRNILTHFKVLNFRTEFLVDRMSMNELYLFKKQSMQYWEKRLENSFNFTQ